MSCDCMNISVVHLLDCPSLDQVTVSVDWNPGCKVTVKSLCSLDLAISTTNLCSVLLI